jgi:hypothetical protein
MTYHAYGKTNAELFFGQIKLKQQVVLIHVHVNTHPIIRAHNDCHNHIQEDKEYDEEEAAQSSAQKTSTVGVPGLLDCHCSASMAS